MRNEEKFEEFWLRYLQAHANSTCRKWHYLASTIGLICLSGFMMTLNPVFLLVGVVGSYCSAWIGHFFVEGNTPLAFTRPVWSLIADYRMYFLALTGRLTSHLAMSESARQGP